MSAEHGLQFAEPPIFERGAPGRSGASLPPLDVPRLDGASIFGALARRQPAGLPEVSEPEAVRHFVRLSQANFSIDTQMYPLGSCTMKYNPKVNEWAARRPGFAHSHPLAPSALVQGNLELMWRLERMLTEITGLADCSLQPAAGAQGELTGLLMIRAYHRTQGRSPRKVLVPESAHGTNPASCSLSGLDSVKIPASADGLVHPEQVAAAIERVGADDVCAFMVTNPNTLGLFEAWLPDIARQVHDCGGLVYGDGANTNAIMGRVRPGDMGVDVVHLNLHKTFSTPHGAGGPGSGPVCFTEALAPFQPIPVLERGDEGFKLSTDRPSTIGRMRAFQGNFGVLVRAYTYIRELGAEGLENTTNLAVLNARYLSVQLADLLVLASELPCMHEAVFSDEALEKATGVKTLDVAKRLLDYGFHAPTVYFPLVVKGALMIEPTESETKQTLDELVSALRAIVQEAEQDPDKVKSAPHKTRVGRLDEAGAARRPRLRWNPGVTG
ncbi:MAG: aminomethyl-transferring glycine dehydrogenase subunit GcvPB [Deltaproteobacteria bacterium]|nr:aminomethyl-transferring glycine dehydrogenase subunit GcvPB [Deltaproteobacteria bacterium]